MRARYLGFVGVAMILLIGGCASTIPEEQVAINEELRWEIKALKNKGALVDSLHTTTVRMASQMETQTQDMEAHCAEQRREYDSLANTVALLSDQIASLEQEMAALKASPRAAGTAASPGGIEARYRVAIRACRDRQFAQAMDGFRAVLREAPDHKLADNAQYWFAECYYATGQFEQAIAEFQKVFAYPKTEKDDDAQLKIAYSYDQIGDKAQALVELNKLLTDYPESDLTGKARAKMAQIEGM